MIIALDAASTDLSVALAEHATGRPLREAAWTSAQRQSAELLPRVVELVEAAGCELSDTTAVAVGLGPGSFTGLRVALALAKGLAVGLDRPLVGVPSLEAWLESEPSAEVAVARAGAREAYVLERGGAGPLIADQALVTERLAERPVVAPDEVASAFGLRAARSPQHAAAVVAHRAAARLANEPAGDDVRTLQPIYLRAPRGLATPGTETDVRWR